MLALLEKPAATDAEWECTLKETARRDRRLAMEMLVRRYRERLYQHALYILKNPSDAYDAVQEVFIKAMREPRFFDEDFHVKAWLYRITSNYCFNYVRDQRRRGGILEAMPKADRTSAGQVERVRATERRDEVLGSMEHLSPEHREILVLRYYDDLSYNEIADVLGVKLGTVMSRLSRARTRLGEVMGSEHPVVLELLEVEGCGDAVL